MPVLLVACGSARSSSSTSVRTPTSTTASTPTEPPTTVAPSKPKGFFTLTLQDSVRNSTNVACPPRTSAGAQCFVLVEAGDSPQLGAVAVAPVLDVEYPPGNPFCGAMHAFVEKLIFHPGDLLVRVQAPYLCLGAVGTTRRTFTVMSGTGRFAADSGSGAVQFNTMSIGASENWEGNLSRR